MNMDEIREHLPALASELERRGVQGPLTAGHLTKADPGFIWVRNPVTGEDRFINGPISATAKAREADGSQSVAVIRRG